MARILRLEFAGALYHINVFQGRYKAILVEQQSYLLELARYIVLNSVGAQMVHSAVGAIGVRYPLETQAWIEQFVHQMAVLISLHRKSDGLAYACSRLR